MRMQVAGWLVLIIGTGTLMACQSSDPVARGRAFFTTFACDRCHSIGEEGGNYGPNLTYIGFRKTAEWMDTWLKNPHAWKKNTVMPNLNLRPNIRKDLIAYLVAQQGQAFEKSGKPWEHPELQGDLVKKGEVIFEKVGCIGCHGIGGVGGNPNNNVAGGLIPSLRGVSELYNMEELIDKIRMGSVPGAEDPSKPGPMIEMPQWGKVLLPDELKALAEYLATFEAVKEAGDEEEW